MSGNSITFSSVNNQHNMKTKQEEPVLVFHTGKQKNQLTFTNISNLNKIPFTKRFREISNKQCLASANGWFVMEDKSSVNRFLLWNPTTRETIDLPPRNTSNQENLLLYHCFLLAPPTDSDCMVVFWGKNLLVYWKLGDSTWTKQPYDLGNANGFICTVTVSAADRCIYALTTRLRLAIIDRDPGGVLSIRLLTTKAPKLYHETYSVDKFLLEFSGDIYVAFIHYVGWSDFHEIYGVEVFKRDVSKKDWVKVEDLGHLALCLSETNAILFSPTVMSGIKRNHVYIILDNDRGLYVHCMEDNSLSLYALKLPTPFFSPFWSIEFHKEGKDGCTKDESDRDLIGAVNKLEKEILSMSTTEIGEQNADSMIKLPDEMLKSIAMRLPLPSDCMNFRLTCKAFRRSLPRIQWTVHPSGSTLLYPWLLISKRENSRCNFLDPICNVTHCLDMPKLLGAKIWFSMAGWLVVSKRDCSMFLFNPFTEVTIALPKLEHFERCRCVSLSSPPTCSDCIVFGILPTTICYVRVYSGEHAWTFVERQPYELFLSISNPVFHKGAFYCLGCDHNMGIFRLKDDGTGEWTIHSLPSPLSSVHRRNYLVKSKGNLLSVFVGGKGAFVRVYRLQIAYMSSGDIKISWESLNSLEDQMVFVSRSTSLSLKAISKDMENKIYFPLLFRNKVNNYMFYSVDTCKWHSVLGDCCSDDMYDSTEQLHCTWIQPTLRWNNDDSR